MIFFSLYETIRFEVSQASKYLAHISDHDR